ncbi:ABC transporter permease subunit [Rugosimonospora africana]|uniref:ABC transporter permease n=1 Tax=Rugosimonospora africana TaxID=556532 RepID=A0A8J3R1S6_9ACTN|nr:ABC transporter permease subunit [Rugosimonospora africana]GIH21420.1 ABC transporter permease [Rugosimonospora africana]
MTTTIGRVRPDTQPTARLRTDILGTLASEFVKIRSVRATYWTLIILIVASIGSGATYCAVEAHQWPHLTPQDHANFDPTQASVLGVALLGQFVIAVLGAQTITAEYSTGMMRTSLTVMPRRTVLYGAKAAVLAAVTLIVALSTSFASFVLGQALLAGRHAGATLSQPHVLRSVIVTAGYVAVCGVAAFGLGAILRHTAAAVAAVFVLFELIQRLAEALPHNLYTSMEKWLPGGATVGAITATTPDSQNPQLFSAWGELAVLGAYAVILVVVGAVLFRRRDA